MHDTRGKKHSISSVPASAMHDIRGNGVSFFIRGNRHRNMSSGFSARCVSLLSIFCIT